MGTVPPIPPAILLILPFVVSIVSGLIGQKVLPNWLNGLILLATLIGAAFACLVLTGKLTNNWYVSIGFLVAFAAALVAGPLKFIQDWLQQSTPSIVGLHLLFQQDVVKVEKTAQAILKPRASAVSRAYSPPKQTAPVVDDNLG